MIFQIFKWPNGQIHRYQIFFFLAFIQQFCSGEKNHQNNVFFLITTLSNKKFHTNRFFYNSGTLKRKKKSNKNFTQTSSHIVHTGEASLLGGQKPDVATKHVLGQTSARTVRIGEASILGG